MGSILSDQSGPAGSTCGTSTQVILTTTMGQVECGGATSCDGEQCVDWSSQSNQQRWALIFSKDPETSF